MPVSSQDAWLPKLGASVVIPMHVGALGPARYAGDMAKRRPYPSDLSDARWELIEPVLAVGASSAGAGPRVSVGRPSTICATSWTRSCMSTGPGSSGATFRMTFRTGAPSTGTSQNVLPPGLIDGRGGDDQSKKGLPGVSPVDPSSIDRHQAA